MSDPFHYDRYSNLPYTSTISALMLKPAEAQSAAALASGQAWAGAANNIGQAMSGALQQAADPRRKLEGAQLIEARQNIEGNQLKLDTARRVEDTKQRINALQNDPAMFNGDGTLNAQGILGKLSGPLPDGAAGPTQPPDLQTVMGILDPINKSLTEARDSHVAYQQKQQNAIARVAAAALKFGAPSPEQPNGSYFEHAQLGLAALQKTGLVSDADVTQTLTAFHSNPAAIPGVLQHLMSLSTEPDLKLGKDEKFINPLTKETTVDNTIPDEGGYTINGQRFRRDGTPIGSQVPPQAAPAQTHTMRLPGVGDVPVDYVPNKDGTGGTWKYLGKDVTGQVKGIPPASITIRNENAKGLQLPSWATDASRPSGPDGNTPDPAIRMTPNGLHQAALTNIATGQFPPTGRGTDPIAVAQREAITSKVGAIAADAGMDVPALRAFYKSNAGSLNTQVKLQDAVQGFMATADKNAALLKEAAKGIGDTGSPLFNQPLRAFASRVMGNPQQAKFATYLQSVSNEYAKIISSPNLSSQLTDSARHEAETLLSPTATVAQMLVSLEALSNEGTNRVQSIGDTIQRIQGRLQGGGTGGSTPPPPPAPKPGGVTVTSPRGKVYPFATQADADRFVADAKAKGLWK